eukprot:9321437-Pyramimonas_sp.AAC.1
MAAAKSAVEEEGQRQERLKAETGAAREVHARVEEALRSGQATLERQAKVRAEMERELERTRARSREQLAALREEERAARDTLDTLAAELDAYSSELYRRSAVGSGVSPVVFGVGVGRGAFGHGHGSRGTGLASSWARSAGEVGGGGGGGGG